MARPRGSRAFRVPGGNSRMISPAMAVRAGLVSNSDVERVERLGANGEPMRDENGNILYDVRYKQGKEPKTNKLTQEQYNKIKGFKSELDAIKAGVVKAFGHDNLKDLYQDPVFKMHVKSGGLDMSKPESWRKTHREWAGILPGGAATKGRNTVNGVDVFTDFRPWQVFKLDPQTAKREDIKAAFRKVAKSHHPDVGGDPRVFQRLKQMRDSLLAFR